MSASKQRKIFSMRLDVVNEQGGILRPTSPGPAAPVVDMSGAAYAHVIVFCRISIFSL
ncbi:hypothetical protein BDW69DRAFT_179014 [Aspergillus filifer]